MCSSDLFPSHDRMYSQDTYVIPQRYLKDIMIEADTVRVNLGRVRVVNLASSWDVYSVVSINECVYSDDNGLRIVMEIDKALDHPFGSGRCTTYMDVSMTPDEWVMMLRDAKLNDLME